MTPTSVPDLKSAADIAKSLVGQLHTNAPLLLSLGVAALVPAFAPSGISAEWRLAFRAAACFFTAYFLFTLWFAWRPARQTTHHLKRLGAEEKMLLRTFLLQDKRTAHLNTLFAPSASLIAKGILTYATSLIPAFNAPVVIQAYAWDYLRKHPELVGLTKSDIGKEQYEDDSPWLTKP